MARSPLQCRQDAERARQASYDATLGAATHPRRAPPDFQRAIAEVIPGFAGEVIRDPADWKPHIKSRDAARLRLAAARHLFARYPVPPALEAIWLDQTGLDAGEIHLRKHWYVVAASGGSLSRAGLAPWLTRQEIHRFLTAPPVLGFNAAIWYAIARGFTESRDAALRVAQSKIARSPRDRIDFWRTAARLCIEAGLTVRQIDDLSDFLGAMLARAPAYSLKGRTIGSLLRAMHDWHIDLGAIERIEAAVRRRAAHRVMAGVPAGEWAGAPLSDWAWQPATDDAKARRLRYVVRQLRSATDLVHESRAMRHCVASYASLCFDGRASIWTLRRIEGETVTRLLTIELDPKLRVVQVRGLANRPPKADEVAILDRWAFERGLTTTGG